MKKLFAFLLLCGLSAATLNAQPQTVRTTSDAISVRCVMKNVWPE